MLIPAAFLLLMACNSGSSNDSVETAKDVNEAKKDSAQSTETIRDDAGQPAKEDQEFLVEAASGGLMEVQLGQMAAQKAANAQVKQFGQMMVDDHSKVNEELKALAARKNITIPTTPGEDHRDNVKKLTDSKGGKEFDKDYVDLMVDDHKEDVDKFEKAAKDCKDPDIKAFAAKHLPHLQMHLQKARTLQETVKK